MRPDRRTFLRTALLLAGSAPVARVVAGLLDPAPSGDDGILPVGEAFIVQPALWDHGDLVIGWNVAPGCYLYRDKLSVEPVMPAKYELGPVTLPPSETIHDEHFGEVGIYRETVQARFRPFSGLPPRQLRVRYQGCAENKVCYPMQSRVIDVITS